MSNILSRIPTKWFKNTLESINVLPNCETVQELIGQLQEAIGTDYISYYFICPASLDNQAAMIFSTLPEPFKQHYRQQKLINDDPIFIRCRKQSTPFLWRGLSFDNPKQHRVLQLYRQYQCEHGMSFPGYLPNNSSGHISLHYCNAPKKIQSRFEYLSPYLLTVVHHLNARTQQLIGQSREISPMTREDLTQAQKKCLIWLAEGKTNWEIANILNITEDTVKKHISNLIAEFNVQNRTQLISKAVALSLISIKARKRIVPYYYDSPAGSSISNVSCFSSS